MIVALLNQKGGVGKTTLALHLAGRWAGKGKRVLVVDADPQGSALDWSEQRAREQLPRLFGVLGLARETLHRELPAFAADADHVIVDGAPRTTGVARSALLAADLILIPATPSPFDGWASAEMLRLLDEARVFRPELVARMVLNRCAARTLIAREVANALADVLRHSAATAMLRHGISLDGVGAVLRHRSPATTMHYAKVDLALLSGIAQPWAGRQPC